MTKERFRYLLECVDKNGAEGGGLIDFDDSGSDDAISIRDIIGDMEKVEIKPFTLNAGNVKMLSFYFPVSRIAVRNKDFDAMGFFKKKIRTFMYHYIRSKDINKLIITDDNEILIEISPTDPKVIDIGVAIKILGESKTTEPHGNDTPREGDR